MKKKLKIGIAGCGAIGRGVGFFLDKELNTATRISCLYDTAVENSLSLKGNLINSKPAICCDIQSLVKKSDLVIESASWNIIKPLLTQIIKHKKNLVVLSIGGLLQNKNLLAKAKKKKVNIYLPSGAICGVDGVLASSCGKIRRCVLTTAKPPEGLKNVEYLKKKKINLRNISKETVVFKGTPQRAFKFFPKNINVASTLVLASDFKDLKVIIKINPKLKRNTHQILLDSNIGKITVSVENLPSGENPKTSTLAIASTKALIKKLCSPLKIGT